MHAVHENRPLGQEHSIDLEENKTKVRMNVPRYHAQDN
jgi:hypothetical protein